MSQRIIGQLRHGIPAGGTLSRRRLLAAMGGVAGAGLGAACSTHAFRRAAPAGGATGATAAVKRGGTLTSLLSVDPPAAFETHVATSENSSGEQRLALIYSGLFRLKVGESLRYSDRTIEGELAAGWEQPDPQTIAVRLRSGVRFHDKPPVNGRELTSADVKFSLDRLLAGTGGYRPYFTSIDSVEAPDPASVVLKLKAADAALPLHLACGYAWVIAREAGKADTKDPARLDYHDPAGAIGTGPFMLDSASPNQTTLVRHPRYFEAGLPYLDGVNFDIITDPATQLAALQTGQTQTGDLPSGSEADFRTRNPKLISSAYGDARAWHHGMRVDQPPFNDVRVRRALALAWNQDEVKQIAGYPEAPSSYGSLTAQTGDAYLPPDQLGDAARWWKPDLTQAKQLLAAAGYANGFETDYNSSTCCETRFLAEQLAADLAKIGIKLNIKVKEHSAYAASTHQGMFTGVAGDQELVLDPGDWFSLAVAAGATTNISHVTDPKVEDLNARQRAELDPNQRTELIHELVRYLAGQVYQLVMPQFYVTRVWQPSVRGYAPRPGYQPSFAVSWMDR